MKKILCLILLVATMASCITAPIEQEGATLKTVRVKVNASEWRQTDMVDNNYFYAAVDMPEITEEVFDYGEVKAYAVYDRADYNYARKHLLPYVLHKEYYDTYLAAMVGYTETIDFTYGIGWAEFNFRASDFAYELDPTFAPTAMDFDIVITYPQEDWRRD